MSTAILKICITSIVLWHIGIFSVKAQAIFADTAYVNQLNNDAADAKNAHDYGKAYELSQQAGTLAQRLNYNYGLAAAFIIKSACFLDRHDNDSCVFFAKKALQLLQNEINSHPDQEQVQKKIEQAYGQAGTAFLYKTDYAASLNYFQKAHNMAIALGNKEAAAKWMYCMGIVYGQTGENEKSLKLFKDLLVIHKELKNQRFIASDYNSLGLVSNNLNEREQALDYFLKASNASKDLDKDPLTLTILNNTANAYQYMNNWEQSIAYREKGLAMAKEMGDSSSAAGTIGGLGVLYTDMPDSVANSMGLPKDERFKKALEYQLYNLNHMRKNGLALISIREALLRLSVTYERMGEMHEALEYFKKYIALRDSIDNVDKQKELARLEERFAFNKKEDSLKLRQQITDAQLQQQILLASQQQQQLQLANKEKDLQHLAYLNQQVQLEKEKNGKQKVSMQASYNAHIKNQEIQKQQDQINTDKKFKIVMFGVIALVAGVASIFYYNHKKTARLITIVASQNKKLENMGDVKDKLFSVISHDMRAPLNALIAFTQLLEDENLPPEKLRKYAANLNLTLNHTSSLMDNLLNWTATQMQGFNPILENTDAYQLSTEIITALQAQQEKKNIHLRNLIAPGTMICVDTNMMSLVLRNLISNAIKFTPANGHVTLSAVTGEKGAQQLIIADNGIGMDEASMNLFNSDQLQHITSSPGTNKEKGTGLGLLLCKTFVQQMNGVIVVKPNAGGGCIFTITV